MARPETKNSYLGSLATEGGQAQPHDPPTVPAYPSLNAGRAARWRYELRHGKTGPRLLELLALVPPLMMLREVLRSSHMHFYDYWWVLLDITNPDGTLRPEALFGFRNEHPFVLPSLLFWLSARYLHGSNHYLGFIIIGLGIGCVLLARALLPTHLGRWPRAGLVVAASALVFNPHGVHNFIRSMSGASWILATLLVLAGLLAVHRGRPLLGLLLVLIASTSYGTAFAGFPALAAASFVRRDRARWQITPLVVGAAVVLTWLFLRGPLPGGSDPTSDPAQTLQTGISMLGMLWTSTEAGPATIATAVALALLLLHSPLTLSEAQRARVAPWWGLVIFALGCAAMIAQSRDGFGAQAGLQSRYTSMSVALWLATLVIVMSRPRWPSLRTIAIPSTILVTVAVGAPVAKTIRDDTPTQELLAIGARAGVADTMSDRFPQPDQLIPRLRQLGHFPYSQEFDLGCARQDIQVGSRVDTSAFRYPSIGSYREPRAGGFDVVLDVDGDEIKHNTRAIKGWAISGIQRARCVAIIDQHGTVVGGGVVNLTRPDADAKTPGYEVKLGFRAIAPANAGPLRVAFEFPDGWWWRGLAVKNQQNQK